MGLNNLADIFKQEYYSRLEGGILEAFGVLFKDNIRIYAYPVEQETFERYRQQFRRGDNVSIKESQDGLINVENLLVADNLRNLYKYIRENGFLETIKECDRENMRFFSRDIFEKILERKAGWKDNLPDTVSNMIETKTCGLNNHHSFFKNLHSKLNVMYLSNSKRVWKVISNLVANPLLVPKYVSNLVNAKNPIELQLPWWSYKSISHIQKLSFEKCLEWGSGGSTLFLAKKFA